MNKFLSGFCGDWRKESRVVLGDECGSKVFGCCNDDFFGSS